MRQIADQPCAPTDLRVWKQQRAGVRGLTVPDARAAGRAVASATELVGQRLPTIEPLSLEGRPISLCDLSIGWLAVYFYPGNSDDADAALEDARQHRAFRRHERAFEERSIRVAALSSQPQEQQVQSVWAHDLQHAMLRDTELALADRLCLPTVQADGKRWFDRVTLLALGGVIEHVFHPVTRASANPEQVLAWIELHA